MQEFRFPVTKPQLLRELVKLALHDIRTPFCPKTASNVSSGHPAAYRPQLKIYLAQWPGHLLEEEFDGIRCGTTSTRR